MINLVSPCINTGSSSSYAQTQPALPLPLYIETHAHTSKRNQWTYAPGTCLLNLHSLFCSDNKYPPADLMEIYISELSAMRVSR